MNKYYVYAYLDPRKICDDPRFSHEPFYIGRGAESRLNHHINEARKLPDDVPPSMYKEKRINMIKVNKIRSIWKAGYDPIIIKLVEGLSMEESKAQEAKLIEELGRSIFGEGPLTNLTPGGEGRHICNAGRFNPFYGKTHTPETRQRLSKLHKGKTISVEMRTQISEKLTNVKKPRSQGENLRKYRHNLYNENPDHPTFQRLAERNSKTWRIQTPTGEVIEIYSLRKFCKENGLNVKTLMTAYNQKRATRDGWLILKSF